MLEHVVFPIHQLSLCPLVQHHGKALPIDSITFPNFGESSYMEKLVRGGGYYAMLTVNSKLLMNFINLYGFKKSGKEVVFVSCVVSNE